MPFKAQKSLCRSTAGGPQRNTNNAKPSIMQRSWTYVTSKFPGWTKQFFSTKGVVSRGDALKEDSGSHAPFTEQGSCASHRCQSLTCNFATARMRRCTQRCCCSIHSGKYGRCSKIVRLLEGQCPVIWIRIPRSRSPKSWDNMTGIITKKLVRTSIGRIMVRTILRRRSGRGRMGESARMGMLICASNRCFFCQFRWMR